MFRDVKMMCEVLGLHNVGEASAAFSVSSDSVRNHFIAHVLQLISLAIRRFLIKIVGRV